MHIYGLKACDTCRKAAKALEGATLIDVRADGLDPSVLDEALETFGAHLLNTRSTTWRALSEAERAQAPRDLILAHPALMKRPLIVVDGRMHLGWTAEVRTALGVS